MKISHRMLALYIFIAFLAIIAWFKFAYPQLAFIDLSIDKKDAFTKAGDYLTGKGIDITRYRKAIVLEMDYWADRYLQKVIGFKKEEEFLKKYSYDLFYWSVRFFIENQKEEYIVKVSSKSGEVISFSHFIEDTEKRATPNKEASRLMAENFLKQNFGVNFLEYDIHEEQVKNFDNRTDYPFDWQRKDVAIPSNSDPSGGMAKLLTGATVSGGEIRLFFKNRLDIPEKFKRHVQRQIALGNLLSRISFLWLFSWIVLAIVKIINRKNDLLIKRSWRFYLTIGIILFTLQISHSFNELNQILFQYPTSSILTSYLINVSLALVISAISLSLFVVIIGTSSELFRYEVYPAKKTISFIHYINSSFFSKQVSGAILFGYLLFLIFLGLQALLFHLGQKFLGVWVDKVRISGLSSSYLPFLSAFIIGVQASFSEEIVYRIFGINWLKKYIKNAFLAVLIAALVWGFGHSNYTVFPVWFRGIEVGILGIFYGLIFLRYGIIPLIVAHYLFDVYWESSAFILGHSNFLLFTSSLILLILPAIFSLIAFLRNKPDQENEIELLLNTHQRYNLEILVDFLLKKRDQGQAFEKIKDELISCGWDQMLVELAINKIAKNEY
ncbi:MAG: type II CAAX endopeptidase family protein [Candidatus Omnitrophota bacterium]